MNKLLLATLFALVCFFTVSSVDAGKDFQDKTEISTSIKRIAVLEFDCNDKTTSKMLAEWTISVLMDNQDYKVIERMLLRKILEEQTLGLSGVVDDATIARVGKISGASHLFFGALGKMGQKYLITLKIIDVNSAETIFAQRGSAIDLDSIPDLLASLINQKKDLQASQEDKKTKIALINGLWDGFFQYDDPKRGYVKGNFTVDFKQLPPQSITGEITEPWSDGFPKNYDIFHSRIINGAFNPSIKQITFTKKYDYDGHIVEYIGTMVGDDVMTGRWNIGTYTGSWRAIRRK